jgi:hypothetical protein
MKKIRLFVIVFLVFSLVNKKQKVFGGIFGGRREKRKERGSFIYVHKASRFVLCLCWSWA